MSKKEERDRSKERKKRVSRRYGQAKLKHAKKGIWSCMIAGIVLGLMIVLLIVAYMAEGQTAAHIGGMGLSAMVFAATGIYMARKGFREREKDYLTCKIGMTCNTLFFIAFAAIFCWGLF